MQALNKEAAVIVSSITGFAVAVIGLLVAFGIDVSEAQQKAIVATIIASAVMVAAVGPVIRRFVYSKDSVQKIATKAAKTGRVPDIV